MPEKLESIQVLDSLKQNQKNPYNQLELENSKT